MGPFDCYQHSLKYLRKQYRVGCQNLQTNNILAPEQYAFRKGMSTEDIAIKNYMLEKYSVAYQRLLTV